MTLNRVLRQTTRALVSTWCTCVFLAIAAPAWSENEAETASKAPANVLVVLVDTLRQDHLGIYGYPKPTSPFIDELFADGLIFENAFAQAPRTATSTASMFTGSHFPLWIYLPNVEKRHGRHLLKENVTFAEVYAEAGFETFGIFPNPNHHIRSGFPQGFETALFLPPTPGKGYADADDVRDTFQGWHAARDKSRPFLAYVHFMDVHNPYDPPKEYRDMFVTREGTDRYVNGRPKKDNYPEPGDVQFMKELYDGEIRYTDTTLRSIWEMLEASGDAENTIVVLCSDHGDEFMEHGGLGHGGQRVEKVLLHVPLLVRGLPGAPARRVPEHVGNLDLFPTLLDVAGIEQPSSWEGRSLRPLFEDETAVADAPRTTYAHESAAWSVTTREWHHIRDERKKPERLYRSNAEDPLGMNDVMGEAPKDGARMKALIDAYIAQLKETREISDAIGYQDEQIQDIELPDEITEQLEALGYIE